MLLILLMFCIGEVKANDAIDKATQALYMQSGIKSQIDDIQNEFIENSNNYIKLRGIEKEVFLFGFLYKTSVSRSIVIPVNNYRFKLNTTGVEISCSF